MAKCWGLEGEIPKTLGFHAPNTCQSGANGGDEGIRTLDTVSGILP